MKTKHELINFIKDLYINPNVFSQDSIWFVPFDRSKPSLRYILWKDKNENLFLQTKVVDQLHAPEPMSSVKPFEIYKEFSKLLKKGIFLGCSPYVLGMRMSDNLVCRNITDPVVKQIVRIIQIIGLGARVFYKEETTIHYLKEVVKPLNQYFYIQKYNNTVNRITNILTLTEFINNIHNLLDNYSYFISPTPQGLKQFINKKTLPSSILVSIINMHSSIFFKLRWKLKSIIYYFRKKI